MATYIYCPLVIFMFRKRRALVLVIPRIDYKIIDIVNDKARRERRSKVNRREITIHKKLFVSEDAASYSELMHFGPHPKIGLRMAEFNNEWFFQKGKTPLLIRIFLIKEL